MEDFNLFFFHELGHYVAAVLNSMADPSLEPFDILVKQHPITGEFAGSLQVRVTVDHGAAIPAPKKEQLAEHLAQIYYGCIFQSYYAQTELSLCLNGKGYVDFKHAIGILYGYKFYGIDPDITQAAADHLLMLRSADALAAIMALQPGDYLTRGAINTFSIDMPRLKTDMAPLVPVLRPFYDMLLNGFRAILNKFTRDENK